MLMGKFISKLFGMSEREAAQIIRNARFGPNFENLRCPYCRSPSVVKFGFKSNRAGVRKYRCANCGKIFNDLTGTPMNGSKLSLREWIIIAYLFLVREEPIFSIANRIGRPYPTVWNAVAKLREMNGFVPHLARILALLEFQHTLVRNGM